MKCYCAAVPPTLSYIDPHFEELKATLVEHGRGDDLVRMKCQLCGKQWILTWLPYMHTDIDILAEEGYDYGTYWHKRLKGIQ